MKTDKLKYLITVGATVLLVLHLVKPALGIDATTVALLLVAALPFCGPLLKSLGRSTGSDQGDHLIL